MTPAFDEVQGLLKKLPGLGYRSAERIALKLLVEDRQKLDQLIAALKQAAERVHPCPVCGNICEEDICAICADESRNQKVLCIVEQVPDLITIERSHSYRGLYHVLHGKLSPVSGVTPEKLNLALLKERLARGVEEIILALSNDLEGEATCHYIQDEIVGGRDIRISRIGFGLPSGGGIVFADSVTLRSALEGRRDFRHRPL